MNDDGGLRPEFRKRLPDIHWQSIETGGTGSGVPDSNYCKDGYEGWIEYKQTGTTMIASLARRPEQVGWISKRVRFGGRVWVAVRRHHDGGPRKGPPVDELWMIPGRFILELQEHGLYRPYGPIFHGGPAKWVWDAVRQCLLS